MLDATQFTFIFSSTLPEANKKQNKLSGFMACCLQYHLRAAHTLHMLSDMHFGSTLKEAPGR